MSFSNSALTPAMMEASADSRYLVTLLTKFFVSFGQFILPFIIIFLSAEKVPFTYVFNFIGIAYLIIGIICFLSYRFPDSRISNEEKPVTKGAVPEWKRKNFFRSCCFMPNWFYVYCCFYVMDTN